MAIRSCSALARRFEAVVFDWDGIASPDRGADAGVLRRTVEAACAHGLELAVVSDTHVGSVDGRLAARPAGPGGLIMALNHGSEVFSVGAAGPKLAFRRTVTAQEDAQLSRAARLAIDRLAARGLGARILSERLNRRRIGPIPERGSEAIEIVRTAAADAGLADPRVTGDASHVEIGLTDKSDSARWVMRWLWQRGIASGQVLIAGDDPGPIAVLEDQIARRRRGELPIVADDPAWTLAIDGIDPALERGHESLITLADGRLGTRGSVLVGHAGGDPTVLMAGVYAGQGAETRLLEAPRWNAVALEGLAPIPVRRVLDLHTGVLHQELGGDDRGLRALMFSSLARPGTPALRATGPIHVPDVVRPLVPPAGGTCERGEEHGLTWMHVSADPASIATAASDRVRGRAGHRVLDRVAAYEGAAHGRADHEAALDRARSAARAGFDVLLAEHRQAWAARWAHADVAIGGDPELQLAVRHAIFHLIASVADEGEAAVGARGLTGRAYRGHVFWDSDVYVLPFLAATHPPAARAMLEYRIWRLPAALRAARLQGRKGARFPWESAQSGRDVTPDLVRDHRGDVVPILTGRSEEHIVADVAWAAACYIDWSGDGPFASAQGLELLVQTARWWASRIEPGGHIRQVIGPDEYHVDVDDNAFTNVMARWNLRRAAQAGAGVVDESERRCWLELAETIVDGYDPETGIYEQFDGFHALEPLLIAELAPQRPVAAELLLGAERTRAAQVVKQADVLMLHYLIPDEVAPDSLAANVDFYEPRTAHGSTLSPGVHAALLARTGRLEQATEMLRLTARIDLDDIGHMTAGGLHLAAMGSVWRALALGFAGVRPVGDALAIDPVLASCWESLALQLQFRGSRIHLHIAGDTVRASAQPPARAISPTGEPVELTSTAITLGLRGSN